MVKGINITNWCIGMSLSAAIVNVIVLCSGAALPMHKLKLFLGGTVSVVPLPSVLDIDTSLVRVQMEAGSRFCTPVVKLFSKKTKDKKAEMETEKRCKSLGSQHDVQGVAQYFCQDSARAYFSSACEGYNFAYVLGQILVIVHLVTGVMQGLGCYILFDYSTKSFKSKHRKAAMGLLIASVSMMFLALGLYGGLVLFYLERVDFAGLGSFSKAFLSTSKGGGTSIGFYLLVLSWLLQAVGAGLSMFAKVDGEEALEDAKLDAEFNSTYGKAAGYGSSSQQPPFNSQQPFAQQPYAQQSQQQWDQPKWDQQPVYSSTGTPSTGTPYSNAQYPTGQPPSGPPGWNPPPMQGGGPHW